MALLVLAACSVSTPSAKAPITLPELPVELVNCGYGVAIPQPGPGAKLSQLQTETLWLKDRKTLRNCRNNHNLTVQFYNELRSNLNSPEL